MKALYSFVLTETQNPTNLTQYMVQTKKNGKIFSDF